MARYCTGERGDQRGWAFREPEYGLSANKSEMAAYCRAPEGSFPEVGSGEGVNQGGRGVSYLLRVSERRACGSTKAPSGRHFPRARLRGDYLWPLRRIG